MLGAASLLTLVTLAGLVAGFAREWLIVAVWGAGARTDAFVMAMFLPEALRTILAAGVLSSAALAGWHAQEPAARARWLGRMTVGLVLVGLLLAAVLAAGAPWWVRLMAPGLDEARRLAAQQALSVLAWSAPGLLLQALWAVPPQARGRFVLAGWGSLLYNLPALAYLAWARSQAHETALAAFFVAGSVTMAALMLPSAMAEGMRWGHLSWSTAELLKLGREVAPLLGSAAAGQGLMLVERVVASYLGEGVVTVVNLARKLVNLPLIALMSLNQVLLGLMSRPGALRLSLLKQGLAIVSVVSLPAAIGLTLSAPALVALLFPKVQGTALLPPLLSAYAALLVVAGWNTLLARYNYADGDTRLPLTCELWGGAVQAVSIVPLAWWFGPLGIVASLMLSLLTTAVLLVRRNRLSGRLGMLRQGVVCTVLLMVATVQVAPFLSEAPWLRLLQSSLVGIAALVSVAGWLRPWNSRKSGQEAF